MIRTITGTVDETMHDSARINVHGFGLLIHMPERDAEALVEGSSTTLFTHLSIKESGVDLYGFAEESALILFTKLLSVSGVGPRSALGVVNLASVETLEDAIRARDLSYLTRVAGVGKRMAEKIVVDLKDKVGGSDEVHSLRSDDAELLDALISLGYKEREAKKAIQNIPNTIEGKDARLKAALKKGV